MRYLTWSRLVILSIGLLIFMGVSYIGVGVYDLFYKPLLTPSMINAAARNHQLTDDGKYIIILPKSTSASTFAHLLHQHQLISSEFFFRCLIRFEGASSQLKAGYYDIKPGESAQQLLYRVIVGDVLVEMFRIIEGTTLQQVSAHLSKMPYLIYQSQDWTVIQGDHPSAEGLLLADTYRYNAGETSKQVLQRAHEHLNNYLAFQWANRSPGLPYKNSYQLLIAASILEKEAAYPDERRLISGIIVNRLHKYMPLQMDPTVIYGLGTRYQGKLLHADLQIDSPYNSYRNRGLPPTPIAMVGKDAIDAAAHPQMTNYLYFVAKGDGHHQFSVDYKEQQQAIQRFLRTRDANH